MKRRLFVVVSSVVCIATAVLWIISDYNWPIDFYSKTDVGALIVRENRVRSGPGQLEGFFRRNADTTRELTYSRFKVPGAHVHWDGSNGRFFEFHVDYLFVLAIAGVMPLWWVARTMRGAARRYRAARGNLYRACGYDLRATPERCPECGTAVEAG